MHEEGDISALRNEIARLKNENLSLRHKLSQLQQEMERSGWAPPEDEDNTSPQISTGMLEYRPEDEDKIISALILNLDPGISLSAEVKTLPAYILFMMIRYADHLNDINKMRSLLVSILRSIKELLDTKGKILGVAILWLSNILRLLHILKQYSGQLELENFDLSGMTHILSHISVRIYINVVEILEEGILMEAVIAPVTLENHVEDLLKKLDIAHYLLSSNGVDNGVINQIFRQLIHGICAGALNAILTRKEFCNGGKGHEIRRNIGVLEEWGRRKWMEDTVKEEMKPVIQAAEVLVQMEMGLNESDNDVSAICDNCDGLTVRQIVQLLKLYSRKDGSNVSASTQFIESVKRKLHIDRGEIPGGELQNQEEILLDTQHTYAVQFPFNPSKVKLEDIEIPEMFGINEWVRKI